MLDIAINKYRLAVDVLQRGRDALVDDLADMVLDQEYDLADGGYLFNELVEIQGTRLHLLSLLVSQLEQSAESLDELRSINFAPPAPPKKRRSRAKKIEQTPKEGSTGEA
jgi:hypothetical protein